MSLAEGAAGDEDSTDPNAQLSHTDRIFELFDQLRSLPKAEQPAALAVACGDDQALQEEVASLLGHDTPATRAAFSDEQMQAVRSLITDSTEAENTAPLPETIDDYDINGLVGEGGMGRVFDAQQGSPRRRVALKIIRPGYVSAEATRRFEAEIELLGRLQHPGIAQVYDAGEAHLSGVRQPFVAMEFVEGLDLRRWSRNRPLEECIDALIAIAEGVHHAHQRGVIHRDLKPANILVTAEGQPKILDFGVARAIESEGKVAHSTMTGQMIGTLDYMSPEQLEGRRGDLGFQSDVYALGVIGFEILTGGRPHELTNRPLAEVVHEVCQKVAPSLRSRKPELPLPLDQVFAKALAKEPGDRYATAANFAEDLKRWRQHRAVLARPPSSFQNLRLFAKRNPALSTAMLLLIFVLAASAVAGAFLVDRMSDARDRAEREAERSGRAAYRSALSSAETALRNHDSAEARRFLEGTETKRRDWIWRHLHSRLDQSAARIETDPAIYPFPKTPLIANREGRVRYIEYAGGSDGQAHVIEIDLKENRVLLRRRIEDIAGFDLHEQSLPVFAFVDGDRLAALDLEKKLIWTEGALTGEDRKSFPIASAEVLSRDLDLEVREIDGVRIALDLETESMFLMHDAGRHYSFVRASSDGRMIAVAGVGRDRRVIFIYDRNTGQLLHELSDHRETPRSLSFSPDSTRVAIPITDGTIHVHDLTGKRDLRVLHGHRDRVGEAIFSPDGSLIASASQDTTIRIWDETRDLAREVLVGHDSEVFALAFSGPNDLISIDEWGSLRQWSLDQRRDAVLRAHELFVYPLALSPDGTVLASGSWDGSIALWDAHSGDLIAHHQVYDSGYAYSLISGLDFTPDGRQLVVSVGRALFAGHELRLVDVASGETVKTLGPIGSLSNLVVASKANRLIVSAHDRMRVYDMATWNELHQAPAKSRRLALHPDGRKVAYRDAEQLLIKDIVTHETVATLPHSAEDYEGTPSEIVGIAFSPDGRWLAVSNKNDVVILDVATGSTVHRLQGHTGLVYSIAFSPDGRSIATGANDRSIRIWDTRDFKEVIALRGHSDHVQTVLWSADGERLYSSSGDYTVRLWDTLSRRERLSLASLKR